MKLTALALALAIATPAFAQTVPVTAPQNTTWVARVNITAWDPKTPALPVYWTTVISNIQSQHNCYNVVNHALEEAKRDSEAGYIGATWNWTCLPQE